MGLQSRTQLTKLNLQYYRSCTVFVNDKNSLEVYEFLNSLMVIIWMTVNYLSSHKRHTIVTQVLVEWVYF